MLYAAMHGDIRPITRCSKFSSRVSDGIQHGAVVFFTVGYSTYELGSWRTNNNNLYVQYVRVKKILQGPLDLGAKILWYSTWTHNELCVRVLHGTPSVNSSQSIQREASKFIILLVSLVETSSSYSGLFNTKQPSTSPIVPQHNVYSW